MSMTTAEANANKFLGRTDHEPRPTWDKPFGPTGRESLARDQAAWDAARAWDLDNHARREAHIAGVDAKREAERQARRDADEARATDALRQKYFRADHLATEEDFQQDLTEIKRQLRIQAALAESTARPKARL